MKVFHEQVRKTDHNGLYKSLQTLISRRDVKAESHRVHSYWHFKVTKLKPCMVPMASIGSLTCTCSSGSGS